MSLHEKPLKDQFVLSEVKSLDRASLQIKANAIRSDGVQSFEIPYTGTYEIVPHPDLISLFDGLTERLAEYFGYMSFDSVVNETRFKADKAQKKYTEELTKRILSDIKVTGISVSGKERTGLVVKGTYKGCSINTKPLYFTNEDYGDSLRETMDSIEEEVYNFLFEDKKAQLEVAFD